jgi:phage terminase large subunit-like protein
MNHTAPAAAETKAVGAMTRGERVCAFIESFCTVPEGDLVGQLMRLEPFQRKWILAVYDNPHGTRLAILSIGKKNGKTPLIAALVLAHIAGPEARTNSQIVSGAMSQTQAATVFKYAWKMVQASPKLAALVRVRPSLKTLQGLAANVEYRAISRQKKTAHGIAPVLAILDELGQVRGPQDDFVEAIETALGAYDDGMLIVISTQAAADTDILSTWIDDQRENPSPHTVCHVHAAEDPDCDVMDEEAWRQANPALGVFRSAKDMRLLAEKAKRMPSFEASFRNLNLNQRVETSNPLIPRGVWIANSLPPIDHAFSHCDVYAGLDLSSRTDLTALVLIAFHEDRWHVKPYFWTPEKGIHERAKRDRQPYALWAKQGLLRTTPGASIDYDFVAEDMRDNILPGIKIKSVAFDRWRIDVMKRALERIGYELPLENFGQGFHDMAPAVDALESELMNDRVAHGNHPILTMCASNMVVSKDEAGNRKPNKAKSTGRIDGGSALLMAMGIAHRDLESTPTYQVFFAG